MVALDGLGDKTLNLTAFAVFVSAAVSCWAVGLAASAVERAIRDRTRER